MGSSHGRLRSLGTASSSERCCCSLSSRRSFMRALCVIAARCRLPSGFFTILIGLTSTPALLLWPLRKRGSSSLMSISYSSSASRSRLSSPVPVSSSKVGYCSTLSTPLAISCLASHRSGLVRRLRLRRVSTSRSSSVALTPDRPRRPPPSGRLGLWAREVLIGTRSSPVFWSTSRMERLSLWPAVEITFTHTSWPRCTTSLALLGRLAAMLERCTSPSQRPVKPSSSTKAPNSIMPLTRPRQQLYSSGFSSRGGGGGGGLRSVWRPLGLRLRLRCPLPRLLLRLRLRLSTWRSRLPSRSLPRSLSLCRLRSLSPSSCSTLASLPRSPPLEGAGAGNSSAALRCFSWASASISATISFTLSRVFSTARPGKAAPGRVLTPPPVPPLPLPPVPGMRRLMMLKSVSTREMGISAPLLSRSFLKARALSFPLEMSMMNSAKVLSAMPRWFSSSVVILDTRERYCSFSRAAIPPCGARGSGSSAAVQARPWGGAGDGNGGIRLKP
mmetsp:Transcript_33661/g.95229  ORF Transcript_33661/g.95229 Transcript_33661/m.95229 type:complete len:501 (+) Transcript_33661:2199-3701(+)